MDFEVIIVWALITEAESEPFNTVNAQVYDKFSLQTGILTILCHLDGFVAEIARLDHSFMGCFAHESRIFVDG
jgi:hypothetical protein